MIPRPRILSIYFKPVERYGPYILYLENRITDFKPQHLDRAAGPDRKFYLSIACPAGPDNYNRLKVPQMTPLLDFYNLMAYDYAGSWDQLAGHQSNIYSSNFDPPSTPFCTNAALKYYIDISGVPPSKMILGMPLYGRAFTNTDGPGSEYNGVGPGSWENGVWDYKALPRPGATEQIDTQAGASWCYDSGARTMVSYDNQQMSHVKADLVKMRGLGGGMWWESSSDKGGKGANASDGSLIGTFVDGLGGVNVLDQNANAIDFPESKYDNLRSGFPGH